MKPVCAVTGATGYVGSRIAAALETDFVVVPLGRNVDANGIRWSFSDDGGLSDSLRVHNVSVLVHTAWDFTHPQTQENWKTNVEGSKQLIEDAKAAGIERIVFVSTISAFDGARSEYGKSKLAVEQMVLAAGGTVVRPGLVWGECPGGMFGSLRAQVNKGGRVPVIGDGRFPQYLVHEDDLAETVRRCALGEFAGRVLTAANPKLWLLRDLILRMASEQGTSVKLTGVPWKLIYAALKTAETLGLKPGFRSDSVVSLVYQDPSPHFTDEVELRPFV